MAVISQSLRLGLALCAVAALTGCDKPKWRGGPKPTEAAAPAAAPAAPSVKESNDPLPAGPAWTAEVLGKNLRVAYPGEGACVGNTDAVEMRYVGAMPGTKIVGWGWDPAAKAAVQRIVLIDRDFKIMGTGETGLARPDVTTARPEITSATTGWSAVTTTTKGPLDAYGVLGDGKSVCKLGHIEF